MEKDYRALVAYEDNGKFSTGIRTLNTAELPEGDLLIRVHYSSLNYKDALSSSGNRGSDQKLSAYARHRCRRCGLSIHPSRTSTQATKFL